MADHESREQQKKAENGGVPAAMIQQAEAVAAGEHDPSQLTAAERKHMGHDVSMEEVDAHEPLESDSAIPQPAYGDHYGSIQNEQEGFGTNASVAEDGRVNIRINQRNRKLSQILAPVLKRQQSTADQDAPPPKRYIPPSLGGAEGVPPPPPMNVVINVVGSRGDVQPFIALGKVLKDTYGHRVRLATHPNFKDFVIENGLEFFNIGGDPAALMAFMVKNPGLMPGFDSLRTGDVGKRRREVGEYLRGCWRSCFETGDGSGPEATDDTIDDWTANRPDEENYLVKPFVADCIIANPPSFAGVHCAEKMGIPLHVMFTMPYSPTQAFPHPLANIQSSNADDHLTNYISYALIDMLTWQGLGDVINRFRQKSLGLEPLSLMWAPGLLERLRIPMTYCWSPALIPKPRDWGTHIDISGFWFLDLATNYNPDPDLKAFLDAGPPPVYIGFGSIVLDDPNTMTELIFEAVRKTGQRALVSKGWGGMGANELGKPDNVFMLGNCPHDWLFQRVSCVVHHGGAGTTAAGIRAGKPTLVVPFFGDQPFWGSMVARAGAGPDPIPNKQLTAENLAEGVMKCLEPQSQERAKELAAKIESEPGADSGAQSFHQFLDIDKLRCNLAPSRAAVWRVKRTEVRLSAFAVCTLANEGLLDFSEIKLYRPREYETDDGPWDPISGGATALIGTMSTIMLGVADFPIETLKALKIHPDATKKDESKDESKSTASDSVQSPSSTRTSEDVVSSSTPPQTSSDRSDTAPISLIATSRTSSFNVQESLAKLNASSDNSSSEGGTPQGRMNSSMASALRGNLEGVRSRSGSGSRRRSRGSSFSNDSGLVQTVTDTGKGVNRIVGAGMKSPMDFTLGLAKGFHNAPKLYGDDTVRKADQITDFKSGLKAATKEFGLGMYDGITGLVTQPARGAAKEGAVGFIKGIGMGIGGIMLKPGAAIFGIPGYTMKGIYKEMQKRFGSSVQNYIIAARTAQGYEEWQKSTEQERKDIVTRWRILQKNLKKKRNPDELVKDILEEQMRKKDQWIETKKTDLLEMRRSRSRATSTSAFKRSGDRDPEAALLSAGKLDAQEEHRHRAHTLDPAAGERNVIEAAIKESVQATSSGDAEDDALVEQGIRASLADFEASRNSRPDDYEDDELRRAIEASTADAHQHQHSGSTHDPELERALVQSLKEHRGYTGSDDDFEKSVPHVPAIELRDDETPPEYGSSGKHVAGTTKAEYERQQDDKPGEKTQRERTEEEIVLEYVKRQSSLEADHQQKKMKGTTPQIEVNEEDDETLQRAMKMSMNEQGKAS